MIAGDGLWECFEFIHLGGTKDPAEMLADACQAWSLLKPGGILIFGGGDNAKPGTDAFLSRYRGKMLSLLDGDRVAVVKKQGG